MMNDNVRQWMNEQFEGDSETIALVWGEYLNETAVKLDAVRTALAASDFPELDRLAHTLKGNALMVGDTALVQASISLRDAAKASDAEASGRALARLAELDLENRREA